MSNLVKFRSPGFSALSPSRSGFFSSDIDEMFTEMDRLMNSMRNSVYQGDGEKSVGNYRLDEKDDRFEMEIEMPGLGKDDVDISVQNNTLHIVGKQGTDTETGPEPHHEQSDEKARRRMQRRQKLSYSFNLAKNLDVENISAEFTDGVLYLEIPKSEDHKPRKIEIKSKN